jgi:hypothetical protein
MYVCMYVCTGRIILIEKRKNNRRLLYRLLRDIGLLCYVKEKKRRKEKKEKVNILHM